MRKVPFCAEVEVRFFPSSLVKNDLENRKIQSPIRDSLCADRAKIGGKTLTFWQFCGIIESEMCLFAKKDAEKRKHWRKNMIDTKKEQERDELHRAIWAIADELRGAVDG